jgi:hypothetical protein
MKLNMNNIIKYIYINIIGNRKLEKIYYISNFIICKNVGLTVKRLLEGVTLRVQTDIQIITNIIYQIYQNII